MAVFCVEIVFPFWGFPFLAMSMSSCEQSRQFGPWSIHTVVFHHIFCFLGFIVFLFVVMLPLLFLAKVIIISLLLLMFHFGLILIHLQNHQYYESFYSFLVIVIIIIIIGEFYIPILADGFRLKSVWQQVSSNPKEFWPVSTILLFWWSLLVLLFPSPPVPIPICPVGWGCRIHWLHLCIGVRPSQRASCYDTKQSDMRFQ